MTGDECALSEFHGIGYDAGIGDARIVEECDTRILRGEEQVVGIGIHRGEHQPLSFGRMECERGRRTGSHGGERAALDVKANPAKSKAAANAVKKYFFFIVDRMIN